MILNIIQISLIVVWSLNHLLVGIIIFLASKTISLNDSLFKYSIQTAMLAILNRRKYYL